GVTTTVLNPCTPGVAASGCKAGEECLARSDAPGGFCLALTQTRPLHFENTYYAIELIAPANPSRERIGASSVIPLDGTDLKFTVVGGGFPLAIALGIDALAQQPKVVVTDPDQQTI